MDAQKQGEQLSFVRIRELDERPLAGRFDLPHLQALHGYIFQDSPQHGPGQLRDIPGQLRVKNRVLEFRSGRYYVPYERSEVLAAGLTKTLSEAGGVAGFRGLDADAFSTKLAKLYGDLDHLHGFLEGNSRTLRQFTKELAKQAGYRLDWSPSNANAASRDALYIARDHEVIDRAFPGLDRERAMRTQNRLEYESFVQFKIPFANEPRLHTIIRAGLSLEPLAQTFTPQIGEPAAVAKSAALAHGLAESKRAIDQIAKDFLAKASERGIAVVVENADTKRRAPYAGQVVAMTTHHALQQTGPGRLVRHRLEKVPIKLEVGQFAQINYGLSRSLER